MKHASIAIVYRGLGRSGVYHPIDRGRIVVSSYELVHRLVAPVSRQILDRKWPGGKFSRSAPRSMITRRVDAATLPRGVAEGGDEVRAVSCRRVGPSTARRALVL